MRRKGLIISILLLLIYSPGWAAKETTSGTFLKIGLGARAAGMGEAFGAVADDSYATYWNPSGLIQLKEKELGAMHNEWFQQIQQEFVSYVHPIGSQAALAFSATYLSTGMMEGANSTGIKTKEFDADNKAITLSGSRYLSKKLAVGINVKYINICLEEEKTGSWAMDIGLLHKTSEHLKIGLVGQNLAPKLKFIEKGYSLPLNFKAGISYQTNGLTLALDLNKPKGLDLNLHLGTEYRLNQILALRLGYKTEMEKDKLGESSPLTGLTSGMGVRIGQIQMDYAYVPYGNLGETHRISFSTKIVAKEPVKITTIKPAVPVPLPPPPATASAATPAIETEKPEKPEVKIDEAKEELKPIYVVNFDDAQATLSPEACRTLAALAEMLKGHPKTKLIIGGHTDSRPICTLQFSSNQALSESRAEVVSQYLINKGVAAGQIQTVGYADRRPVAPNITAEGMSANRRVEIILELASK